MQYPSPNINPNDKKEKDFLLKYCQAVWHEVGNVIPDGIFFRAAALYQDIRDHALGQQDMTPYKKPYVVEEGFSSNTSIDFKNRSIFSKLRDMGIDKIMQRGFNIVATAIDPLAKDESETYYADLKVKILMKETLQKNGSDLVDSPVLAKEPDEPGDLEELKMQMDYGDKFNRSIDAEEAWELVAYQNDFAEQRRETNTNLFDFGVGGYKEWLDANGNTRLRAIYPGNIITSFCRKKTFSDASHIGEVIEVPFNEFADEFTEDEMKEIRQNANTDFKADANRFREVSTRRDKANVLDIEILTIDDLVYSQTVDSRGNYWFGRADYKKLGSDRKVNIYGREENKYIPVKKQTVYKAKWIIGTNYIYDYGEATNQKRDTSNPAKTKSSYHLYAYNFHDMKVQGMAERMIPIFKEYLATIFKIQNFKENWIPYIIDLDLDALEAVAVGKGGLNWQPKQLIKFLFQKNIIMTRRRDISNKNINYKSVNVEATPMAAEFQVLIADAVRLIQDMKEVAGLNDFTDGSTPDPRALSANANAAQMGTISALSPLINADKNLNQRLAEACIQRVQITIKNGKVPQGIVKSLGTNTVRFIKVSPDLPLHIYGIMIEDRPSDQERQMLFDKLNIKDAQGLIEPEDLVMVMNTRNLKQAEQLFAYKVKKRREKQQQEALQMQQQNGQIQIQSAQAAEQAKQQTAAMQHQFTMEEIQLKIQGELEVAKLKVQGQVHNAQTSAGAKVIATGMQHQHEERQNRMEQGLPVGEESQLPEAPPQEAQEQPAQNFA